jgi:hypothetical protein
MWLAILAVSVLAGSISGYEVARHQRYPTVHNQSIRPAHEVTLADRATVVAGTHMIAPTLALDGRVVNRNPDGTWEATADVAPADVAYRFVTPPLSVSVSIVGGPDGLPCAYRGTVPADDPAGSIAIGCRLAPSTKAVAGLRTLMVVELEAPKRQLTLPVTSVRGDAQRGSVVLIYGGRSEVRTVVLGAQDGENVAILSGISAGDRVLKRPLESDFSAAE